MSYDCRLGASTCFVRQLNDVSVFTHISSLLIFFFLICLKISCHHTICNPARFDSLTSLKTGCDAPSAFDPTSQ